MKNLLVVHGANLNLLGEREPELYGTMSLDELNAAIKKFANGLGLEVRTFQSNHEGALLDFIHENRRWAEGIVINAGAFTHYSYALRDAILSVNLPAVDVHLSDIYQREEFRRHSVLKDVCIKQIVGLGSQGYLRAVEFLVGNDVIDSVKKFISCRPYRDQILSKTVELLKTAYPKYTWVGIYLLEGDELVLHNYLGKPSPHTRIPVGKGICGAAVQERASIIVPDVNADPRYLACSLETRSEIVVPIMSGQSVYGEIDIDSDLEDIFHEGDQQILEKCAELLLEVLSF